MNKLFFIITLLICFSINYTQAQGYIRAGGGVGFNVGQDAFVLPALQRDSTNDITMQSVIWGSFGQGARFSVAGGYMITPYFGVELEIYYFQGFKQDYGSDKSPTGLNYNRTGYSYQMRGIPSLVVKAPTGKFQPYARFGVLIPFFGKTVLDENWAYANNSSKVKQTEVDGKFSVGFESSIGLQYNINDNLGIYVHATYTGLRIRSDKATVVKDNFTDPIGNSTDNLATAKMFTTQIEFQDVMTKESNYITLLGISGQIPEDILVKINGNTLDADKPLNLPTQTSNFNALTFSVGVTYTFNKKEK